MKRERERERERVCCRHAVSKCMAERQCVLVSVHPRNVTHYVHALDCPHQHARILQTGTGLQSQVLATQSLQQYN